MNTKKLIELTKVSSIILLLNNGEIRMRKVVFKIDDNEYLRKELKKRRMYGKSDRGYSGRLEKF